MQTMPHGCCMQVVAHELQLHAWNDVVADGREYVVDLMDDAGALYEKVRCQSTRSVAATCHQIRALEPTRTCS